MDCESHIKRCFTTQAEEVIQNIREALSSLLSNAKWMDKETRTYAINKLKHLKIVVGYPDWQRDKKFVNNYYGNVSDFFLFRCCELCAKMMIFGIEDVCFF